MAPNRHALWRAPTAPAWASSDKSKQPCACSLRVTNAVEVQSVLSARHHAAQRLHADRFRARVWATASSPRTSGVCCIRPASVALSSPSIPLSSSWRVVQAPRGRERGHADVGEVVKHRKVVHLACRCSSTVRKHSNMVKQQGCVRAALWGAGWVAHHGSPRSADP